jgi:hypothetical protein
MEIKKITARNIFLKLGYYLQIDKLNKDDIAYRRSTFAIVFTCRSKEVLVCDWNDYIRDNEKGYIHSTDLGEFKAIQKQMQELGWLD